MVLGQQSDGGDSREVTGAFLDATDVVELGQFRQELGLHVDAGGPGIVVDADRYLDRSRDAFVVIENLIRRQRPIGNRQHHDAIAADVLGVLAQCDARRRGARASARNQGNTAIDMFGRNGSCRLHFLIGEGAVAAGAAEDAYTVDTIIDLKVDRLQESFLVDLLPVILRCGGHESEHT